MVKEQEQKKVGIITFHRAINYGAILQVYALQRKVIDLGVKCEIIDYRNKTLETIHDFRRLSNARSIKGIIKFFLIDRHFNERHKKFREFSHQYLNLSKPLYDNEQLKEVSDDYSSFFCGSDQVWNLFITDFDKAYFLNFVDDPYKKNSYAASFGINRIPSNKEKEYKHLLEGFNNILVREKQGAKIIQDLVDRDSKVVLDPTLLISKDEWFEISDESPSKEKYILIYAFGGSKKIIPLARKISNLTGYKIISLSNEFKNRKDITFKRTLGPTEFLGYFRNAEYILTNSFHGTAFSINFNKQFYTELLPKESGVNSRIEDLLHLFNLTHRLIDESNIKVDNEKIDYASVNSLLSAERTESLDYLFKAIHE